MRTSRLLGAAALAVSALLVAGCTSNADTASTEAAHPGADAPLYDQLPQEVQDAGVLVFAGDTHPPYRTIEADGTITGIDPDLLAALEQQLGVDIEIEVTSGLPSILSGMLSGRYAGFNGPVRTSEEREADFDAIVWLTSRTSYAYLLDSPHEIGSSDDLCGLRIAGVTGSVTESQVALLNDWCTAEGRTPAEFIGLADTNATILAVQSDRADALATTETGAMDIIAQTPDTFDYVTQTDEQGAGVDQLAMFAPKSSGLGPVLFEAMKTLFENGQYDELMAKWGLESVAVDEPSFNPITEGAA